MIIGTTNLSSPRRLEKKQMIKQIKSSQIWYSLATNDYVKKKFLSKFEAKSKILRDAIE